MHVPVVATSLKIPKALKSRISRLAKREGASPHALMLRMLEERVEDAERFQQFVGEAHESAMTKIDARSTSFWAAAHSCDKELTGLGLLERQRVKVWLGKVYAELGGLSV